MDENDPVMKMYEAQAIAIEKEQELENRTRELEEARREIEQLRVTTQQMDDNDSVMQMYMYEAQVIAIEKEQELEERTRELEEARREIERLRVTSLDGKTVENVKLQETVAGINRRNEELTTELRAESDGVYSELNPYVSVILLGGDCANWTSRFFALLSPFNHNTRTDSIFLYNSKEKKWINSSLKLPSKLSHHGSVILNDEIYIFGGFNGSRLKSTYKLGENREWIKLADMNMERCNFGSLVFDDEIWVFGGVYEKTVEKYNPQTNSWTFMPQMNQAKHSFAVSIINGKFYVSGGYNDKWNRLDEIEVFDPKKNKWEFFCDTPFGLRGHTSTVDGTNLIIIGGQKSNQLIIPPYIISNEVWKIDVLDSKKEWKKMPNLQQDKIYHNAVKLVDGLMVIGGMFNIYLDLIGTDSVEIFDGQKWKEGPKLPETRYGFSSIPLTSRNEEKFLQFLS